MREFDGYAISPHDPRDNSTSVYVSATDDLYSATVTDLSGEDPLIYRKPLSSAKIDDLGLRTDRNDPLVFNGITYPCSSHVSLLPHKKTIRIFRTES